ncbi:S66 peptidase family protein [Candidatus Entotheonella palauensis]|uniref:S66 peptidase family protein n=1 Tax=Candidatus Entotheonella palauensis TaxID=93172 RepID=UPI000B7FA5A3|nr:LD-carboxypeptidase [Candidatus Entotheonella palauensis]
MPRPSLTYPQALQPGDCIGLIAPASPVKRESLLEGAAALEALGFRVYYTPRIFDADRYLAGSDTARAEELHAMFANPDIKAIFCGRGGYGSQRLIPHLDPALIMAHPKLFLGYSDVTSLLLYFYQRCGLVTLHGPSVAGDITCDLPPEVAAQLRGIVTGHATDMQLPPHDLTVVRPGAAEGRLIGGCLSLFVCTVGTDFQPEMYDTILFLEDRGERYYAIDRMLTHLKLTGMFEGVRGVVFGEIEPVAADRDRPYGVVDVIADVLGDLDVPVLYGLQAGHCKPSLTLPFGTQVAIRNHQLVLCEAPVTISSKK